MKTYADYAWERAAELLAIDSPTGFTKNAALWVHRAFSALGYDARITNKGGVVVDLGGADGDDGLMLCAHTDTLGGMVAQINPDGRLKLTGLGGMEPNNGECENVRLYTRMDTSTRAHCISTTPVSMSTTTTTPPAGAGRPPSWCWTRMSIPKPMPGLWELRWATSSASTPAPAAPLPAT